MKNKFLKIAGVGVLAMSLAACGSKVTEADYQKWAADNGYVKEKEPDVITSATSQNKDGVGFNYGDIDWSADLQKAALKDFLKGRKFADVGLQYGTTNTYSDAEYSYVEMYQVATALNGNPQIATAEYYFNVDDMMLFAGGEVGTGKLLEMAINPNVSLQWTRQLRYFDDEADGTKDVDDIESSNYWYNYYRSYGVSMDVKATILTADVVADMSAAQKAKVANSARGFYHGLGSRPRYWKKGAAGNSICTTGANGLACNDDELIADLISSPYYTFYFYEVKQVTITAPILMYLIYNDGETSLNVDVHSGYNSGTKGYVSTPITLEPGKFYVADGTAVTHLVEGSPVEYHLLPSTGYNSEGDSFLKKAAAYVKAQTTTGIKSKGKLLGKDSEEHDIFSYSAQVCYLNTKILAPADAEANAKIGLKTQTTFKVQ